MRKDEKRVRAIAKSLRRRMTDAEAILWSRLRREPFRQFHFRRQHPTKPFVTDFASFRARLVVEVDGATHRTDTGLARDRRRDAILRARKWRVFRVLNEDIYNNLDNVLEAIWDILPPPPATRAPPPHAGEETRAGAARK